MKPAAVISLKMCALTGCSAGVFLSLLASMAIQLPLRAEDLPAPSAGGSGAKVQPLVALLGVHRAAPADFVLLTDGSKLDGVVLNESFRCQTRLGEVTLPARRIAALDLSRQGRGTDAVISVLGDRLGGFVLDAELRVRTSDPAREQTLRREAVAKIVFRARPGETGDLAPAHWLALRNGDVLLGRVLTPALRCRVGEKAVDVPLADLERARFADSAEEPARVELRGGETVKGVPQTEDLEFELSAGGRVRVYVDWIERLQRWQGLPAEWLTQLATDSSGRGSLPAPPAVHTNVASPPRPGLVWIAPGEFDLGSPNHEKDRDLDEGPMTRVVLPQGFWMGACEVTQAEYRAVMGGNPSQYSGDDRAPVERVNWPEAMEYCRRLTQQELAAGRLSDGWAYRLPTEAEWEYACRAGSATRFNYGDDPGYLQIGEYAWCSRNGDSTTHPVGGKQPNTWGLFDLHGNVWEWCLDAWGKLPGGTITNRPVAAEGSLRIARGGSWLYEPRFCRSANRDNYGMLNRCSDVGFRVVLAPLQLAEGTSDRPSQPAK